MTASKPNVLSIYYSSDKVTLTLYDLLERISSV